MDIEIYDQLYLNMLELLFHEVGKFEGGDGDVDVVLVLVLVGVGVGVGVVGVGVGVGVGVVDIVA